ncbi:protein NRT1/ PTR FAMILY 2.7-like [Nicotiana tabacum]|uniref:Protein NRT1/ PTR FAMILY 2.7-like n=1 Tax=Nicotiana tabacum TaxID=4097 RepID=A0A1S4CNH4_TOBAC|nr:PREDICTED: protein NRT1/ PTR FAMILY 2.7-like [Nicotiana tabacum]
MEKPAVQCVDEAATKVQSSPAARSNNNGGWISFPFIIGSMAGLSLAAAGWNNNLIVYLIQEFNMNSVSAAKVYNMANGCSTIFPILGAVVADSFLGCFSVIWISSFISLLGALLLTFTAAIDTLRPQRCGYGWGECRNASTSQLTFLYAALALAYLGNGGTRFTIGSMGANQFQKPKHQAIFFNWYTFALYTSNVIGSTVLLYIEDNVSWVLGFAICVAFNILGLTIFLSGQRLYRHIETQHESPFVSLAQVVVAAIRKKSFSLGGEDYYHGTKSQGSATRTDFPKPSKFFRFLNRAALVTEGDKKQDGLIAEPWKLCTVQQVEDLKILIKLFPLWTTGLFLYTPLVIQASLAILQALKMDRSFGSHFKIPAGSVVVFTLISTCITITFTDRVLFPLLNRCIRSSLTPLRRVGIGHLLTVVSMALSALVESKRIKIVKSHHQNNVVAPMSVFWLAPQLAITGIGLAFHSPGYAGFYYQEFPSSLKSTSTAVVAVFVGAAFYLGNGVMDLVQSVTGWLPENIDNGRLDNVFWVVCVLGAANSVYYLVCASLYKYKNVDQEVNDSIDKIDSN